MGLCFDIVFTERNFYEIKLPNHVQALIAAVLRIEVEMPTLMDLVYVDFIEDLREVLKFTNDPTVYTFLFHRFPKEMQKRFLQEFQAAQKSPALCEQLAHFPWTDGSRPFLCRPQ